MQTDPALDALFLPFDDGLLDAPDHVVFLGARDGAALRRHVRPEWTLEQEFRPTADTLTRAGLEVAGTEVRPPVHVPLVLVLPPRQREQARALLARAVSLVVPGGRVVACAPNLAGARSMQDDLSRLAGTVSVLSKHKCRVAWTAPLEAPADAQLVADWLALDEPRLVAGTQALSRPGLFAWDRIDPASALLVEHLPTSLTGRAADLGAGWGFLATALLARNPGITALDCFEAQARALPVLDANLAPSAGQARIGIHWHDVTAGIPGRYEVIVSNPPFHADDRTDRPELGQRFIEVAAQALEPGGRFFMVANRHLPYEARLKTAFRSVRVLAHGQGFKAFEAVR